MAKEKMFQPGLPHFAVGPVVKGFGRGSRELKIPTANYPDEVAKNLPKEIDVGVYCGWASIDKKEVHKMILSVGFNPVRGITHKIMEIHIMHNFGEDFFGSELRIVILAFLRTTECISSVDELIGGIQADVENAETLLNHPRLAAYKNDSFFTSNDQPLTKARNPSRLTGLCRDVTNCDIL